MDEKVSKRKRIKKLLAEYARAENKIRAIKAGLKPHEQEQKRIRAELERVFSKASVGRSVSFNSRKLNLSITASNEEKVTLIYSPKGFIKLLKSGEITRAVYDRVVKHSVLLGEVRKATNENELSLEALSRVPKRVERVIKLGLSVRKYDGE